MSSVSANEPEAIRAHIQRLPTSVGMGSRQASWRRSYSVMHVDMQECCQFVLRQEQVGQQQSYGSA